MSDNAKFYELWSDISLKLSGSLTLFKENNLGVTVICIGLIPIRLLWTFSGTLILAHCCYRWADDAESRCWGGHRHLRHGVSAVTCVTIPHQKCRVSPNGGSHVLRLLRGGTQEFVMLIWDNKLKVHCFSWVILKAVFSVFLD